MCAPGSSCGCGGTASDLSGVGILIAGAVAVGGVVAFLAAHLLLLALAAVALPAATLAAVRYLRRYVVLVHKEPPRRVRRAVAIPAIDRPRSAHHARVAAAHRARAIEAAPARAIEPRAADAVGTGQVPALGAPAAAQLAIGGYHLHFHGVSAAEVAALLRRDGEAALLRGDDEAAVLRRGDAAALPAAGDRPPA